MARVTICTAGAERLELDVMDDATAAEVVERLTVAFGKRGGLWVEVPCEPPGATDAAGTTLRWVPSTSEVTVVFESSTVPEQARRLSLDRRPAPALHARTSARAMH
jgi:hypothetical protein